MERKISIRERNEFDGDKYIAKIYVIICLYFYLAKMLFFSSLCNTYFILSSALEVSLLYFTFDTSSAQHLSFVELSRERKN